MCGRKKGVQLGTTGKKHSEPDDKHLCVRLSRYLCFQQHYTSCLQCPVPNTQAKDT